jgi:hypothetical protein
LKSIPQRRPGFDVFKGINKGMLSPEVPTNPVENLVEGFDDMKAVGDLNGLGKTVRTDGTVSRPHTKADGFDLGAEFGAKSVKVSQ